jgi:hypothetical protein
MNAEFEFDQIKEQIENNWKFDCQLLIKMPKSKNKDHDKKSVELW